MLRAGIVNTVLVWAVGDNIGQQDAAFFIQEQYGTSESTSNSTSTVIAKTVPSHTVPQKTESRKQPAPTFNPEDYLTKLVYNDDVAALGINEEDAQALGIGFVNTGLHRGRLAIALRWPTGEIAGFGSVEGGTIKLPSKLIQPKVVALKRA